MRASCKVARTDFFPLQLLAAKVLRSQSLFVLRCAFCADTRQSFGPDEPLVCASPGNCFPFAGLAPRPEGGVQACGRQAVQRRSRCDAALLLSVRLYWQYTVTGGCCWDMAGWVVVVRDHPHCRDVVSFLSGTLTTT